MQVLNQLKLERVELDAGDDGRVVAWTVLRDRETGELVTVFAGQVDREA